MLKDSKGITLIALIITVIVLLILAAVGISGGRAAIKMSKDNRVKADLGVVQHAILERYSKYLLTKDDQMLIGTKIEYSEAAGIAVQLDQILPEEGDYYRLEPSDLKKLGLNDAEHTYIVNYQKGIAFNETIKQTSNGEYLFLKTN